MVTVLELEVAVTLRLFPSTSVRVREKAAVPSATEFALVRVYEAEVELPVTELEPAITAFAVPKPRASLLRV